jgi:hypothetical protein
MQHKSFNLLKDSHKESQVMLRSVLLGVENCLTAEIWWDIE